MLVVLAGFDQVRLRNDDIDGAISEAQRTSPLLVIT